MRNLLLLGLTAFIVSCTGDIKNENTTITEELGTEVVDEINGDTLSIAKPTSDYAHLLGFYVGDFEPNIGEDKYKKQFSLDEGYMWNRNNKINISLDKITDSSVSGHSVVAGNARPFNGTFQKINDSTFTISAKEPGNDKYDGTFEFKLVRDKIEGTWEAYNKIDINKRKYSLKKKDFQYDPTIQLKYAHSFANWNKTKPQKREYAQDGAFEEWMSQEYATTTGIIYEVNASERLLSKSDVENLKRADLQIIRNTIYARHGYSYKNRIYRIFFDAQDWYIPVHTNIKKELTDIEKKNIKLLLRYEKNAEEYYDYFGRG